MIKIDQKSIAKKNGCSNEQPIINLLNQPQRFDCITLLTQFS